MVKNTTGGNKAKQQGRRFAVAASLAVTSVRRATEVGEMYAVVSRILGGKFCQVTGVDGVVRRCSIRKKFMARRRGENNLAVGVWVLVGVYDWEKRQDGTQTCDLLEVYSPAEKDRLKQQEKSCNFGALLLVGDEADQETVAFSEYKQQGAEEEEEEIIKPQRVKKDLADIDKEEVSNEDQEEEDDDDDDEEDADNSDKQPEQYKKKAPAAAAADWINVDDI
jgi:hypothetical protein